MIRNEQQGFAPDDRANARPLLLSLLLLAA
jgi:hypothetical protein